jgi:hypothetical protein
MPTPLIRRLALISLSLLGAILACVRAEVPITPAQPFVASPLAATLPSATPTTEPPTATFEPSPTIEITPTPAATDTPVIAPPPTDTPLPPTETPIPPPATDTLLPPTETPILPTETQSASTPVVSNPGIIPENATFTRNFTISNEGGTLAGRPRDMLDNRIETWASLRGGDAAWIFDLGSPQNVAGLKLYAHPDNNEETTLRRIEVSTDGTNWTPIYVGGGDCGVPECDRLQQREYLDFGFGPVQAQFIRMRGGPTRFAFAEVQIALLP